MRDTDVALGPHDGEEPGAPTCRGRLSYSPAHLQKRRIAGRHIRDQHVGGPAADHLLLTAEVGAREGEAGDLRYPALQGLHGGLHHRELQQAAADGPGDRAISAHKHLRACGARGGAALRSQLDQGEVLASLEQLQDLRQDLLHAGSSVVRVSVSVLVAVPSLAGHVTDGAVIVAYRLPARTGQATPISRSRE